MTSLMKWSAMGAVGVLSALCAAPIFAQDVNPDKEFERPGMN